MIKHLEAEAQKGGAYILCAFTYEANTRAIEFYERNDFSLVATLPDVHGPEDKGMVFMRKKLR